MSSMFLRMICLSAFLAVWATPFASAKTPDAVLQQKNSVVSVYVDGRDGTHIDSGTGFIVDREGVIVTDCRIIAKWITEAGARLAVETEEAGSFPVEEVISSRCENHLALIKIKAAGLPAVRAAPGVQPRQGEEIFLVKRRPGSGPVLRTGLIRGLVGKGRYFRITMDLAREDSGSPLFNKKGEVIGAAMVQRRKGKSVDFAVTTGDVLRQLDKYRKPAAPVKGSVSRPAKAEEKKHMEKKPVDFHEYFSRGCAYDNLGMYREAVEAYRQALAVNPSSADSYINLGIDYYKMGKYDAAIDIFRRAIEVKPDLLSAYNKLGATYIIQGDYSLAIDTLSKAIELDANDPSAHFNRGIAYFLSGDTVAARRECAVLQDIDKAKAESLSDLLY